MGETKQKTYEALVDGVTAGLTDDALYTFVVKRVPKANSKRIVRAALLALSDPALTNRNILTPSMPWRSSIGSLILAAQKMTMTSTRWHQ